MAKTCAAIYLAAWTASAAALGSWEEPLFVLAILGGAMPAIAWISTRGVRTAFTAPQPPRLAAVLAYLAIFSIGVLGFGFTALRTGIPEGPAREIAILAVKLATMTALPLLLFRAPLSRRIPVKPLIAVGTALLAFQAVFGRGLKTLGELHPSPATLAWAIPACFLWLCLEVGVTEEGLFRAVLQTRLAGALRSEAAAIFAAALLFGLAHAPGLYLRGAYAMEGLRSPPTATWAIAYSIAVISPAGFVFGVLWSRTRSFALLVVLHALADLLPNLAPFIRDFSR